MLLPHALGRSPGQWLLADCVRGIRASARGVIGAAPAEVTGFGGAVELAVATTSSDRTASGGTQLSYRGHSRSGSRRLPTTRWYGTTIQVGMDAGVWGILGAYGGFREGVAKSAIVGLICALAIAKSMRIAGRSLLPSCAGGKSAHDSHSSRTNQSSKQFAPGVELVPMHRVTVPHTRCRWPDRWSC